KSCETTNSKALNLKCPIALRLKSLHFAIHVRSIVADYLQTANERFVKALHQRFPAIRHVDAGELIRAAGRAGKRAVRITRADFHIAVLRDVTEAFQMRVVEQIALRAALEHVLDIAFEDLAGPFEKNVPRIRE